MAPQQQQQQQQQQQTHKPDKIALVLIDGVGDVTIPAFGDKTPLQVAHTPNMDCIAGMSHPAAVAAAAVSLPSSCRSQASPKVISCVLLRQ
jgi:hypothetical protein